MVLTQLITRVSKDSFTLTYPSNVNILLVLYPPVGSLISLLMFTNDTMHSHKYQSNTGYNPPTCDYALVPSLIYHIYFYVYFDVTPIKD